MSTDGLRLLDDNRDFDDEDINIFSPSFKQDPHRILRNLRETDPVHCYEALRLWVLTKHADVRDAFFDDRLVIPIREYNIARMGPGVVHEDFYRLGSEMLSGNEPPLHTTMRRVFGEPFTPKRVRDLVGRVETLSHRYIDAMAELGSANNAADIIADYAHPVVTGVISSILDVPEEDWPLLETWVKSLTPVFEATPMTAEVLASTNAAARGLEEYFSEVLRQRRANPGEDFVSAVVQANDVLPEPLTDLQLIANFSLLYFAGQDTQKTQFGNMIWALARHPRDLERLTADTSLIQPGMPELLRYEGAPHYMPRTPLEDVEIRGKTIRKGEVMLVSITAANRDPDVFPDPDVFDLDRPSSVDSTKRHMTFGVGRHYCLGNQVGLMALPLMLKYLLVRVQGLRADFDRAVVRPEIVMNGYLTLPVTWDQIR